MKKVAIFFCICLIAVEGFAGDKQVIQFPDADLERVVWVATCTCTLSYCAASVMRGWG